MRCSPAERKIIEYLLTLPEAQRGNVTTYDVVQHTGSSRSTLDRIARKLGYAGFSKLRRALVIPTATEHDDALDPTINTDDSAERVAWKVLSSVSSRMRAFAELLVADGRLAQLIDVLDQAHRIVMCGVGLSAMVATDLHHRLLRLGLDVRFSEDTHTQLAHVSLMEQGDVAICISYSGRTDSVVRAAQTAAARGYCVALTADVDSPLARCAQLTLTTPPGIGLFGNDAALTRLLQMAFSDVLFHCLALRDPKRLASAEAIDASLGDLKLRASVDPGAELVRQEGRTLGSD
ncbi:MAG: MurR/RpiR family transcriptional regulator [Actinomycetota bacterium]|jgi:DNA-binding MurR/RpiR family transcriptional regulator|nr:MurR/RpiR family transcriptional regulator [Actinomycetota bacterium]MDA8358547.1 MurR/RpiR family transcriptional regulator [Actinomycetota bacterium]